MTPEQIPLPRAPFDPAPRPVARRRKSPSPQSAAALQEVSKEIGQQRLDALRALRHFDEENQHYFDGYRYPTAKELSEHSKIDRYILARRLPELRALGLVTNVSPRRCLETGRTAAPWKLTDKGRDELGARG